MNALADTYVADKVTALRVRIAAAWQVHCIALHVAESADETAEVAA